MQQRLSPLAALRGAFTPSPKGRRTHQGTDVLHNTPNAQATRMDVKLAALRGDLDPKPWEENTERAPGVLMQSLIQFPSDYTFQVGGCCWLLLLLVYAAARGVLCVAAVGAAPGVLMQSRIEHPSEYTFPGGLWRC